MNVWLVLNHDTIAPDEVVLAVCSSEESARALIDATVAEFGGRGVNAFADLWSRAAVEDWEVRP